MFGEMYDIDLHPLPGADKVSEDVMVVDLVGECL